MADTSPPAHEHWSSARGFLMAALGSAVGLGNVWRFSYVAGDNGGGAFLLVYLLMVLLIGAPLLLGEFALGRSTQRESSSAIALLMPASRWRHVGLLGVLASCVILAYYAVIAGWVFKYLSLYLWRGTHDLQSAGFAASFHAYVARPLEPLLWQGFTMMMTLVIVARGVERGIERLSLFLMPALAVLLLALAVRSASLPGFQQAVAFLFQPDWSVLASPAVYLAALGQAFFSIGLAMGVMVTYGSYLPSTRRLPGTALGIALGDTLFAVAAGLVVFPAVFSFGLDPAQGPGLAFVVLPEVFAQMSGGALVGMAFFLLLGITALTSMVSLLEVPVAYAMQRWRWSRQRASVLLGSLVFVLGWPASLGFGLWSGVRTADGHGILDLMDFGAVELLLPLNGLLLTLWMGWVWPRQKAMVAADLDAGRLGRAWHFCLRYVAPILVLTVLVGSVSRT
jgi:NSS family neurotransmitter:Na+ symporter